MSLTARSKISPPTAPGLSMDNLSPTDLNENETIAILANQDDFLDNRAFQDVFSKNNEFSNL